MQHGIAAVVLIMQGDLNGEILMKEYLKSYYDYSDRRNVDAYDELSLWAAPFGLTLLDTVKYRKNMNVLDIGCGPGFPLLELAKRLGDTSSVYGIDPWETALDRTKFKSEVQQIKNVTCINGKAEELPFEDKYFDLVVSNNGINNVEDIPKVLSECYRVLKPQGQMVITMNLPLTMTEFYNIYRDTLKELNKFDNLNKLEEHIHHKRKTIDEMKEMIKSSGFEKICIIEGSFNMKFADANSMFNHYFIKSFFMKPWIEIVGQSQAEKIFDILEIKLNAIAESESELKLTIPYACFDIKK